MHGEEQQQQQTEAEAKPAVLNYAPPPETLGKLIASALWGERMGWGWRLAISMPVAGWVTLLLWMLYSSPSRTAAFLLSERGMAMFVAAPLFVPWLLLFSLDGRPSYFCRFISIQAATYYVAIALCYAVTHLLFPNRPKHRQWHCTVCGCDLRATPDRCPQCGTPTATPLPKQS